MSITLPTGTFYYRWVMHEGKPYYVKSETNCDHGEDFGIHEGEVGDVPPYCWNCYGFPVTESEILLRVS